MTEKIRILFVTVHLDYGGAERGLLTTLRFLDRSRFLAEVVSIEPKGRVGAEIEALGVPVTYLNRRAGIADMRIASGILRIMRRFKPDIIHSSLFYANLHARIAACAQPHTRVITEERSMYTEKRFYHVALDCLLSLRTDAVIVCSRAVLEFTRRQEHLPEKIFRLLYNAVDTPRFTPAMTLSDARAAAKLDPDAFIAGTVGTLIPKKNQSALLSAAAGARAHIPNLQVVIIGDGPLKNDLEKQATALGIRDIVKFPGAQQDLAPWYYSMDAFVLPSLQEGFPRTIVEAMYCGVPVIATRISGIPEIIEEGKNGFLVEAGGHSGIIESLRALFRNPSLRKEIGLRNQERIRAEFTPEQYIAKLQVIYTQLLGSKAR
jgi:L-malate glycosyltransferase